MTIDTGFKDKTGKAIHIDDIVQHRLGKFGKSGGATTKRVIKSGKRFVLADVSNGTYGSRLSDDITPYLVIIDCPHRFY